MSLAAGLGYQEPPLALLRDTTQDLLDNTRRSRQQTSKGGAYRAYDGGHDEQRATQVGAHNCCLKKSCLRRH